MQAGMDHIPACCDTLQAWQSEVAQHHAHVHSPAEGIRLCCCKAECPKGIVCYHSRYHQARPCPMLLVKVLQVMQPKVPATYNDSWYAHVRFIVCMRMCRQTCHSCVFGRAACSMLSREDGCDMGHRRKPLCHLTHNQVTDSAAVSRPLGLVNTLASYQTDVTWNWRCFCATVGLTRQGECTLVAARGR
jgi:hypothetical protein